MKEETGRGIKNGKYAHNDFDSKNDDTKDDAGEVGIGCHRTGAGQY